MCLERFQHQQLIFITMIIILYAHLLTALDWCLLVTFYFVFVKPLLISSHGSHSVPPYSYSLDGAVRQLHAFFKCSSASPSEAPDNDSIMKKPVKTINYEIKAEDITFHIAAEGTPYIWTQYILYESTLLCFVPRDTQLLITPSKDD